MDKKKLTDEQLIHDLEEFAKDTEYGAIYKNALNLIHRLQSENERLMEEKWRVQDDLDNYHLMYQEEVKANAEKDKYIDYLQRKLKQANVTYRSKL